MDTKTVSMDTRTVSMDTISDSPVYNDQLVAYDYEMWSILGPISANSLIV